MCRRLGVALAFVDCVATGLVHPSGDRRSARSRLYRRSRLAFALNVGSLAVEQLCRRDRISGRFAVVYWRVVGGWVRLRDVVGVPEADPVGQLPGSEGIRVDEVPLAVALEDEYPAVEGVVGEGDELVGDPRRVRFVQRDTDPVRLGVGEFVVMARKLGDRPHRDDIAVVVEGVVVGDTQRCAVEVEGPDDVVEQERQYARTCRFGTDCSASLTLVHVGY